MDALKMTWIPHQRHRRRGSPPLGLKNLGNSCYLNSVLQCLSYTPPLAQFCLSSKHSSICKVAVSSREEECPFCILELHIVRCLSFDGALYSPAKIQKCLTLFAKHFRWGQQEDAHEFLRYVIDSCHDTCLKLLNLASASNGVATPSVVAEEGRECVDGASVMKEIFGGSLLSQVKCLSCQGESNKTDEIMDISLDVLQSSSLKDALSNFFQPEVLDGNNKYSCGSCKKLAVARKQMYMSRAPNVLVIQLKRFEGLNGGKINTNIDFEEVLVLSKYMYNTSQDLHPEYNLFGSIVHSGYSSDSGHYYAYIKDASGSWYCCNDTHVTRVSTQEVLSEKVYILFYILNIRRSNKHAAASNGIAKSPGFQSKSPSQKSVVAVNPSMAKSNGFHASKEKNPSLFRDVKTPPKPQPEAIKMQKFQIKTGIVANSNTNLEALGNARLGRSCSQNETVFCKENTLQFTEKEEILQAKAVSADRDHISSNTAIESNKKNIAAVSDGNKLGAKSKSSADEEHSVQDGAVAREKNNHSHSPGVFSDRQSCILERKRKYFDAEKAEVLASCGKEVNTLSNQRPDSSSLNDVKRESQTTCLGNHSPAELDKLKEELAEVARSILLSCGWVDKTRDRMRIKKKLCAEGRVVSSENEELRDLLRNDARTVMLSQIPESLKQQLVQRLLGFSREKPSPAAAS